MFSRHMTSITYTFCLMIIFCAVQSISNEKQGAVEKDSVIFKPTKEWQAVKKGQPIPKGLHVRVNFETGITEAKLLDTEEPTTKNTAVSAVPDNDDLKGTETQGNDGVFGQKLRESLDKIRDSDDTPARVAKQKFRSYEELKQDFSDINMLVQTDLELMNGLMKRFVTSNTDEKISILIDLEYLVHQFDNAREFARVDGFTEIVYPCFNATSVILRAEAMKLLGSAVQSNPQVQITALSSGSIQLLLRSLLLDMDFTVRSRALYALSCLVRNFPVAQQKFINEGGLTVLVQTFDRRENDKLKVKIVTLINDLLQERQTTEKTLEEFHRSKDHPENSTREQLQAKLSQYKSFDLETKIVSSGWCDRVPQLLVAETAKPDNDVVEKVLHAMLALVGMCHKEFTTATVRYNLSSLEQWYRQLVDLDPDEYYKDMATLLTNVLSKLRMVKSEL